MSANKNNFISWNDFEKVELRIGTIVTAQEFPEAHKAAVILKEIENS